MVTVVDASTKFESDYTADQMDESTQCEYIIKADVGIQCLVVTKVHVSTQCTRVMSHTAVHGGVETEHKAIQLDITYCHQGTEMDEIVEQHHLELSKYRMMIN